MGIAAVALLVPAAVCAPFISQLGDRMHRERALALGYLLQGATAGADRRRAGCVVADLDRVRVPPRW